MLIRHDDLPRLRHVCGVAPAGAAAGDLGKFAAGAAHFDALRTHFAAREDSEPLPGELAAAAFLICVAPGDPGAAKWRTLLNHTLREPPWLTSDPFELVLALDWGWSALEADTRASCLLAMRQRIAPLASGDSPLNHALFRQKLASLAFAVCVEAADDPSQTWALLRREVSDAASAYLKSPFPTIVEWRGLTPTTPANGPLEESDAALFLECAAALLERDLWSDHRDSVGRWLEHYALAHCPHPALQHHFLRDDPGDAAGLPVARWSAMTPVTAFLIAARSRDPAAAWVAQRISAIASATGSPLGAVPWRFAPLLFDARESHPCDPQALPVARNLGGAIIFRGGGGLDDTVIWIESAQPFLSEGQHFDAGHFLVRRGGDLVVGAGEGVASEAVAAKGGAQGIGGRSSLTGFEQFTVATISHNALLAWNPNRAAHREGRAFEPVGGQRVREGRCEDFSGPLIDNPRHAGRLLAFGTHSDLAYAALDLAAAYDPRDVQAYTREFIFLWRRALVIVDRVAVTAGRVSPVVTLQLSGRPSLDGHDLPAVERTAGPDNEAGIWNLPADGWLRWTDRRGAAWVTFVEPQNRVLTLAGGPARRMAVLQGPAAGRVYVGSDADGFERLVRPIVGGRSENAWFRLGNPTVLADAVGKAPIWGRVEASAAAPDGVRVFVTVLITSNATDNRPPQAIATELAGGGVRVELTHGSDEAVLELPTGLAPGGAARDGGLDAPWPFPAAVAPDAPLRPVVGGG